MLPKQRKEKNPSPTTLFSREDRTIDVLAALGAIHSEADVNREIVMI